MKFQKRPMDDHEVSFAMSQTATLAVCSCWNYTACNCPPTPTHQVQYDQSTQEKTTADLHEDFN